MSVSQAAAALAGGALVGLALLLALLASGRPVGVSGGARRHSCRASWRPRLALERNELELHYQPKVDFKTGAPGGFES